MATAGSAERPGRPANAAPGRSVSGPGAIRGSGSSSGFCLPEDEVTKCAKCAGLEPGGSSPCGHPVCPLCLARRNSSSEERLRRRSDPEKSSSRPGRRDCDSRRGVCFYPGKLLLCQHHRWMFGFQTSGRKNKRRSTFTLYVDECGWQGQMTTFSEIVNKISSVQTALTYFLTLVPERINDWKTRQWDV